VATGRGHFRDRPAWFSVSGMETGADIVITGAGVVTPIGIGCEPFWEALVAGTSGIRPIDRFDTGGLRIDYGGQIAGFDPRVHVRPRKSLKVMSRDMQFGFAAAELAVADAGLDTAAADPNRFGVVFGADMIYIEGEDLERAYRRAVIDGRFDLGRWAEAIQTDVHPLWLLKHLPNMTASHVAIAHDARGHNNSIVLGDVSSLLAVAEAASILRRGRADVMLAGGTGCRLHPTGLVARGETLVSRRTDDGRRASRPFDRDRDGLVNGEGAGVIVLETRAHAERRGARIRGRLLATAARCEPATGGTLTGGSLRLAVRAACAAAGVAPEAIGHVNAHGLGTVAMDRAEARALQAELGDVPVTAPKSAFGQLGAGSGMVELIAALLATERGLVPPTLNYETPDPECPVNVVHGRPLAGRPPIVMTVNIASTGQAAVAMLGGPGAA
jgi:3-oxoacyl-[acyl-carrier-protein] synthase II